MDDNNNFLCYFIAIGSCVNGFLQCIWPMITIDSAHLKRLYHEIMFVRCLDENNQLYPLVIGIEIMKIMANDCLLS